MPHSPRRPSTGAPSARRWLVAALLALLATPAAPGVGADPAQAADAARWAVRPADNGFGAGRPDLSYTLSPGGRLRDAVELVNPGLAPLRLRLSAADASLTSSGQLTTAAGRPRPDGVAGSVRLSRSVVTVPGGQSVAVGFTVAPRADAAPGDRVGGIVTALDGPAAPRQGPGLPVRLRVGGALRPALAVSGLRTDYAGVAGPLGAGSATVSYVVRNTGNVTLSARQAVSVSGPLGTWSRRAPSVADSPPLPPGARWEVSQRVEDVAPAVRLAATVRLTPLLADAAGSLQSLAPTHATTHAWSVPWGLLLALAVVVALVVGALLLRRSSAPKRVGSAAA